MLQALGSPASLYADIGPAAASLTPVVDIVGEEQGPNEWLLRQRFRHDLQPFRAYCRYAEGLLAVTPCSSAIPRPSSSRRRASASGRRSVASG